MLSLTVSPLAPSHLLLRLGQRARQRRLAQRSGVAASTIKRFETTGELGTQALLMLLMALGDAQTVEQLFPAPPPTHLAQLTAPQRQRGKRADAGVKRKAAP
jgi:transcriptional regulator with XRE-family HTH domain